MRSSLAALSVLLLLSCAAPADAKAKAKPRCGAQTVRLVMAGRANPICVKVPQRAGAPGLAGRTAAQLLAQLPAGRRPHVRASRARGLDRLVGALLVPRATRRAAPRAAVAPAAGGCAAQQPGPRVPLSPDEIPGGAGATGEAAALSEGPEDGNPRRVIDTDVVVHKDGDERAARQRSCWAWDPCPAAGGTLHGTHDWLKRDSVVTTQGKRRTSAFARFSYEGDLVAHVGADARVTTFDVKAFLSFESGSEVRDRSGKLVEHLPTRRFVVNMSQTGMDPRRFVDPTGFKATGRGPKGARLSADEVEALSALVAQESIIVQGEVQRGLLTAESAWYDRFICVDVSYAPATPTVVPGQQVAVAATARAKDGAEVRGTYGAEVVKGDVRPATGAFPATLTYTAPGARSVGHFPTFRITVTSERGRGAALHNAHMDSPTPGPLRFRILDAALTVRNEGGMTASGEHLCATAGRPIHSVETYKAETSHAADDVITLGPDETGRLRGDLTVTVPATRGFELRGCEGDPLRSCTRTLQRDLTHQLIGVSFDAESAGSKNATLSWVFDPPSIGFVDVDDSVCNVQEIFRGLDFADAAQTVPMATFRGTRPFTLGFDGQQDWSADQHGNPAVLHTSWTYFVTLQPVEG